MTDTQKSAYCGFQPYSYRDFTKQLRQLLQDRYTWDGDGFTILKELIQNANDAGATSLHLGWSPPLFDATSASISPRNPRASASLKAPHPLLTVPALFAVNNGPLRASDAINITRLGSNSKAGEASSAGRFGLGLKSVFHLCEAFLYLAQPFEGHASLCSIFNPWSPPRGADEVGPYEHWDFDPDGSVAKSVETAIRSRLEPICAETSPSFCLWIPLRDERVLKGDALIKRYLSGAEIGRILGDSTLHVRLAELLPLLHGLREISVWIPNAKAAIERRFAVSVEPSATRPAKLPEPDGESLPQQRQSTFAGKVIVSSLDNTSQTSCEFVGAEAIVIRDSIQTLWKNKNWPPDESLDPDTNKWREHRVKLIPHGALRFMAIPRAPGRGRVSMHWCVFLPLGQSKGDEHLEVEASIAADVSVFLHGYFFIDAGRTRHVKSELDATDSRNLDAESLQRSWNATIEREAIWPQFLEAFAAFVSRMGWDDRQVAELTRAIHTLLTRAAGMTSSVLPIVCRAKQWLYLLKQPTESNRALGIWTLKAANAVVHEIPRPAASIALYDLLPGIAAVGSSSALTFAGWPRISANEATPWSSTALGKVVSSLVPSVLFTSSDNLEYLARFLEHCANSEDQQLAVGEALWPLLKKAFQDDSLTLQRIEELGATLRRVLEFVPEKRQLVLNWASSKQRGADTAFRLIAKDECDLLPIPSSVKPSNGRDDMRIESTVVVRVLRKIADVSLDHTLLADVMGDLLKRANLDRKTLWQNLKDVRLLVIYDCGRKQTTRTTWLELVEQKRRRLVFCDQAGLTQQLQAALGDAGSVWRIDPSFAEKVLDDKNDKHGLPGCSARECAAVLAPPKHGDAVHFGGAALGAWEARRELLKKLAGTIDTGASDDQERLKDACRLLIHGRSQDANFNAALFLAADGHFDALAEKLVRHVVAKRHDEWRILAGEPATWAVEDGLTTSQQKCLGLYPLTLPAALDFLKEKTNGDQLELNLAEDYATLLMATDASQNDVLKELPIHPTVDGKRPVAIRPSPSQRFLWNDAYPLAGIPLEGVTLLKLHHKSEVKRRQKDIHSDVLGPAEAIDLAIGSPEPEKHWETILKAIENLRERPTDDILAKLGDKSWLPSRFGARKCKDLICIARIATSATAICPNDFRQRVTRLVEDRLGAYVPDWMLDEDIFKQLTESRKSANERLHEWGVFPDENQSLQRLSKLLAEDSRNHIGDVPLDQFNDWLAIDWDASIMPSHQVLRAVADQVGNDVCFEHASADVRRPIEDHDRLIAIVNWLAQCHEQRSPTQDVVLRVFSDYFGILLSSNAGHIPKRLHKLMSQSGKWESPSELCLPTAGIADHCQLHRNLAVLLRQPSSDLAGESFEEQCIDPDINKNATLKYDVGDAAMTVRDYFCAWELRVQLPVIGGFLAVLGEDTRLREYAERVLGKSRRDDVLDELFQKADAPLTDELMTPRSALASSTTIRRGNGQADGPLTDRVVFLKHTYFSIRVASASTEQVRNLLGGYFDAERNTKGDDLLLGFGDGSLVQIQRVGDRRVCSIRLQRIVVEAKTQDDLIRILRVATQSILVEAFRVPTELAKTQAEKLFKRLAKSDYLEIIATQRMILSGAFIAWEQLGLSSDPAFRPKLAELKRCLRSQPQDRTSTKRGTESIRGLDDAYRDLQDLIETDVDAQERCLAAVRHQVGDNNQYNHRSVLFELAQNADDALLEANKGEPFRLFLYPDRIAIRHFGRKINQVPPESTTSDDPHADDLWKMLTLWLTNKNELNVNPAQIKMTGKFGLGFKSVFLVSNQPRLLSGQLACVVVGGVFPRYLNTTERECFDRYLTDLTTPEQKLAVTVIELPLNPSDVNHDTGAHADGVALKPSHIDVASIVGRFRELAHLLVVFAQRIRRIEILDEATEETHTTEWHDQPVSDVTGCFKGTLQPFPNVLGSATAEARRPQETGFERRALVLRTTRHGGALLLVHDGRRFQKLPAQVPTLWVTAPTLEALDVGFALNAIFNLDPGRAQLGRESPKNEEIAADLGREFGQRFAALFEHSRKVGWARFCQDTGLDSHASEYDFWDSLWELLGPGLSSLSETSNAAKLLLQVFWHPADGAARFYRDHAAVPTRLRGASDRSQLVTLRQVRYAIGGVLSTDDGYGLMCVRGWPELKRRLDAAMLVDARSVFAPLRDVCEPLVESIQQIELSDVLEWELPERAASPPCANYLGELIDQELLKTCERREETRLSELLHQIRFQSRDGKFVHAKGLLIGHQPSGSPDEPRRDERMRAEFAPRSRVLSSDYGAPGVAFFEVCRAGLEASAIDMAQWVFDAADKDTRNAALRYLAEGDQGRAIQREINKRGMAGSWLARLAESEDFQSLDTAQQGRLLEIIPPQQAVEIIKDAITPQPHEPPPPPADVVSRILKDIHKWWSTDSEQKLRDYERRTYPEAGLHHLKRSTSLDENLFRKDWVILFLLGLTHTMGRTVAEQHREFLWKREHDGTLRMIASSEREPGAWMGWINDFLDRQLEDAKFLQWMKQFVGVYQVSRHLDDYIGVFESVEQNGGEFSLATISNTRSSSNQQGGGFDAPPLSRVLGMGQCFVLRELVRKGVITNKHAHRHCYVPSKRVRDLLMSLGCEGLGQSSRKWELSQHIHEFLAGHLGPEAATFQYCFDIPFQIIAEDEGLQAKYFKRTIAFKDDDSDLWYPDAEGISEGA